jgi:hypothetical protein
VKIKGASGVERQVDIYWEFKTAGVKYRLIIECKDYKTSVPLEKIDAFHAKVTDIGGAIGVFVSKNGYQRGAIELARKYGIQLREIRKPTDKDWEGYIRNVEIRQHWMFVQNIRPSIKVDKEWAEANHYSPTNFSGWTNNVFIEDSASESVITLQSIINKLNRDKVGSNFKQEFSYDDAYVDFGDGKVKIKGLTLEYDVTESTEVLKICGDDLIKAIVNDVTEGKMLSVHINGDVVSREN